MICTILLTLNYILCLLNNQGGKAEEDDKSSSESEEEDDSDEDTSESEDDESASSEDEEVPAEQRNKLAKIRQKEKLASLGFGEGTIISSYISQRRGGDDAVQEREKRAQKDDTAGNRLLPRRELPKRKATQKKRGEVDSCDYVDHDEKVSTLLMFCTPCHYYYYI